MTLLLWAILQDHGSRKNLMIQSEGSGWGFATRKEKKRSPNFIPSEGSGADHLSLANCSKHLVQKRKKPELHAWSMLKETTPQIYVAFYL